MILYSEQEAVLVNVGVALVKCFNEDFVAHHTGRYRSVELEKFTKGVVHEWFCPR